MLFRLLLLLALVYAVSSASVPSPTARKLLELRDDLMDPLLGQTEPLYPLAQIFKDFFKAFPREQKDISKAPSRLPPSFEEFDDALPYIEGVGSVVIIPLIFFTLVFIALILFTICRGCCKKCGGSVRTRAYSKREVKTARYCMFLVFVLTMTFGMIGIVANVGLSEGVDAFLHATDDTVQIGRDVREEGDTFVHIGRTAMDTVDAMNHTLFTTLPSSATLDVYDICLDDAFTILHPEPLSANLTQIDNAAGNMTNLDTVISDIQAYDVAIQAMPSASILADDIDLVNTSLVDTGDLNAVSLTLGALNDSIMSLPHMASLNANLSSINTSIENRPDLEELSSNFGTMDTANGVIVTDVPICADIITNTTGKNIADSISQFQSLISQLNTLPTLDDVFESLESLDTTLQSLGIAKDVIPSISSIISMIDAFPAFSGIQSTLEDTRAELDGFPALSSIAATANTFSTAMNAIPNSSLLETGLLNVNASIHLFPNVSYTYLSMDHLNATLETLPCVNNIENDLVAVNTTIVILEDTENVHNFVVHIDSLNISQYQQNITMAYDTTLQLSHALEDVPDFAFSISALNNISSDIAALSNLNALASQLVTTQSDLDGIPDLFGFIFALESLVDLGPELNRSHLTEMSASLVAINTSLSTFPSIATYKSFVTSFNTSLTSATNTLDTVLTAMLDYQASTTDETFSGPIPGVNETETSDSLQLLLTESNDAPDLPSFQTHLNSFESQVQAVPSTSPTESAVLSLGNVIATFPNSHDYTPALLSTNASMTTLEPMLSTRLHLVALNDSIETLPNLDDMERQVTALNTNVSEVNFNFLMMDLDALANVSVNETRAIEGLSDLRQVLDDSPDTVDMESTFRSSIDEFDETLTDLRDQESSYDEKRHDIDDWVNTYDGYRLLVFMGIFVLAMVLTFFGFIACVFHKPSCSMCVGITLFFLTLVFWLMTSIQMIPTIGLADHCGHFDTYLIEQADTPQDAQVISYFLYCNETVRPDGLEELYTAMDDFALYNLTEIIETLESDTLGIAAPMQVYFDNLQGNLDSIDLSVDQVRDTLSCENIKDKYDQMVNEVLCEEVLYPWALLSGSLLIISISLTFGICCSIRGKKRFAIDAESDIQYEMMTLNFHDHATRRASHQMHPL